MEIYLICRFVTMVYKYKYNYHDSGHCPRPAFYLKHDVWETGLCLFLQVKPTQMGPIEKASLFSTGLTWGLSAWRRRQNQVSESRALNNR
jgi:hypothetical protein